MRSLYVRLEFGWYHDAFVPFRTGAFLLFGNSFQGYKGFKKYRVNYKINNVYIMFRRNEYVRESGTDKRAVHE
jgi:hypothetical protein